MAEAAIMGAIIMALLSVVSCSVWDLERWPVARLRNRVMLLHLLFITRHHRPVLITRRRLQPIPLSDGRVRIRPSSSTSQWSDPCMSRSSMFRLAAVLAVMSVSALTLPAASLAQTSPSTAAPPNEEPPASGTVPALPKSIAEKVEQHIKQLQDQLGITVAETPQWNQFAQVMRDNAARMQQAFTARAANLATMTAVENMQSYSQLAQVHAANMQKLASAFQLLYNTFPDAQKKVADTAFREHNRKPASPQH
jgi:periplasmic protein CpxP/Spy